MAIESYRFGHMVVDGTEYTSDLVILPDSRVLDGWWRREGHKLWPEDLRAVLEAAPQTLVVGTGDSGLMVVTEEATAVLAGRGIDVVAEPSGTAWQTYNRLSGPGVAAAFHLTC